jgi:hypothetical protein
VSDSRAKPVLLAFLILGLLGLFALSAGLGTNGQGAGCSGLSTSKNDIEAARQKWLSPPAVPASALKVVSGNCRVTGSVIDFFPPGCTLSVAAGGIVSRELLLATPSPNPPVEASLVMITSDDQPKLPPLKATLKPDPARLTIPRGGATLALACPATHCQATVHE